MCAVYSYGVIFVAIYSNISTKQKNSTANNAEGERVIEHELVEQLEARK